MVRCLLAAFLLTTVLGDSIAIAQLKEAPVKVFILAGQSNMVGWGNSLELPSELRDTNDRVLMFAGGKWQPLRPNKKTSSKQQQFGMKEFSFGPEIAFGHEMAKAWPDQTIGIVKLAVGGTSILAWKPDWNKKDADRVGQGKHGSLYKKLTAKLAEARKKRNIEFVGFLWLQAGGDMKKVDVAKEYLGNLKALVAGVRKESGVSDLPFVFGSIRKELPDDLSNFVPKITDGPFPAAAWVLKAQWEAQQQIPNSKMIILRDIEKHPMNVHYNTKGQLTVGRLFAEAFRGDSSSRIAGHTPQQILAMFGAKGLSGVSVRQLGMYSRVFGFMDTNRDGRLSKKEYIDDGRYLTPQARRGIFNASDANQDGIVTEAEYVENRAITDEAKVIFEQMDANQNGRLTAAELIASGKLGDEKLASAVFRALDLSGNEELVIPEYLRVWGGWARLGKKNPAGSNQ